MSHDSRNHTLAHEIDYIDGLGTHSSLYCREYDGRKVDQETYRQLLRQYIRLLTQRITANNGIPWATEALKYARKKLVDCGP